jgi:hypothetical protein
MKIVLRKLGFLPGRDGKVNGKPFMQKDFCLTGIRAICFRNESRAPRDGPVIFAAQSVAPL